MNHEPEVNEPPRGAAAVFAPTVNAIFAPEKAFRALDARPVLLVFPLLWTFLAMVGLGLLNVDITRQMMRVGALEAMVRQGQSPDAEALGPMFERMDRFAGLMAVGGNLFLLLSVVLIAVVLWMGSSMMGGRTNFGRSLGVASIGAVIHPLLATLFVTIVWQLDPPEIRRMADMFEALPSLGLDMFLAGPDTGTALRTLMMRVDLFNIWWVVVVAIGGRTMLGLKKGQAGALAVTIWALTALIAVFWAGLNT